MASMLCPSCRKLISVDEPRCPYCGAMRPGLWGFGPALQRFFGRGLELVPIITMGCIVLYVIALALDVRGALQGSRGFFGLLSPSFPANYLLGMTGRFAAQKGEWLTTLTAIYLHGGLLHIFFNVMWIRQLGSVAEDELGPARFFVVFSLAGAGGFLVSIFGHNAASVGASGSIFGLLGCMIAFRRRRGAGGDMMSQQFIQWAVALFILGLVFPGVDNWAHGGGFVVGYVLGQRMHGIHERPEARNVQLFALVLLAMTVAGFVLAIVKRLPEFLGR